MKKQTFSNAKIWCRYCTKVTMKGYKCLQYLQRTNVVYNITMLACLQLSLRLRYTSIIERSLGLVCVRGPLYSYKVSLYSVLEYYRLRLVAALVAV